MPKSHNCYGGDDSADTNREFEVLLAEFCSTLRVKWCPSENLSAAAARFLRASGGSNITAKKLRVAAVVSIITKKLKLNREVLQSLWDELAKNRNFYSPAQKAVLASIFDNRKLPEYLAWLRERGLDASIADQFCPITESQAISAFHEQLKEAKIRRSDARKGVQDERRQALLSSVFGSWIYALVDVNAARRYFARIESKAVPNTYFELLQEMYPDVLNRKCGGVAIRIRREWWNKFSFNEIKNLAFRSITDSYDKLSNHSYCAVLFEFPNGSDFSGRIWELIGDITVYAERLKSEVLKSGFFHPGDIEAQTKKHIQSLNCERADFKEFQYGFAFKDCIVNSEQSVRGELGESRILDVLLLLEKHKADETAIPCPSCWSVDVRGNSYPIFGVKSWECQNSFCPERSAFDRGNRFSAMSILRHEAAKDLRALIPEQSLKDWKLDVVSGRTDRDFFEMFVRHYTLPGDSVHCLNWPQECVRVLDRKIVEVVDTPKGKSKLSLSTDFEGSAFFQRYLYPDSQVSDDPLNEVDSMLGWLTLYCGSCLSVLNKIDSSSLDGAITSPPYYNAREYSVWPNLYAYLYDMRIAAEGVYRVLRPGAYYLFNIFDYFDNDNIMSFSALGKRRLPLGAYMTQIFRRCGFIIEGNIVWHKGEIEGKRNYNQGNLAPFFQLPLNTWEHILILRKPGDECPKIAFPQVIYRRPVFKMVNGENRHGHTAPFPISIPMLLCEQLPRGAKVIDPFGGSLTTAQAANRCGQRAVAIELHAAYCELGVSKLVLENDELPLFADAR